MPLKTFPFDTSEYLDDSESQAELLADALETGDPSYVAHAIGVVARARGMTELAKQAGVTREALYKAIIEAEDDRTPMLDIVKTLGLRLQATSASEALEERLKA